METHLREMKEITDRLASMGSPFAEDDQVMTLLGSLPSSYGSLVMTLGVQIADLKWSDVQAALLDEETRRKGPVQPSTSMGDSAPGGSGENIVQPEKAT